MLKATTSDIKIKRFYRNKQDPVIQRAWWAQAPELQGASKRLTSNYYRVMH